MNRTSRWTLVLLALVVSANVFTTGCALSSSTGLPELPSVPALTITPRTLPDAFTGSPYQAVTITTSGGSGTLTSCTALNVTAISQGGSPLPFEPASGLTVMASGGTCIIQATTALTTPPGTYTFTLRVADSSTPPVAATQTFTLRVVPGFVITTPGPNLEDAVINRTYTKRISTNVGTMDALGNLRGKAPLTNCQSANPTTAPPAGVTAGLPPGLMVTRDNTIDPTNTVGTPPTSCRISGTPTTAGAFQFRIITTDSETTNPATGNVREALYTIVVRQEFAINTFTVVDGIQGRPYSNTFIVSTTLSNGTSDKGQVTEKGNGPITACSLSGLPAGISATSCTITGGISVTVTLTGTPTTVGSVTGTIQITDSTIPNGDIAVESPVVPTRTASLNFGFRTRAEYAITPFTVVDGVQNRAYDKTFTVVTNLSNNPVATEVNSTENGNGPPTACTLSGLPAGINFTCTIDASGTTATVHLTGTPTTTGTVMSTLTLTDSDILQSGTSGPIVVAKLDMVSSFSFTVRSDFAITPFTVVDGVQGRSYSKTFTVTTNLANDPTPTELGSSETGNGPITACTFSSLPTGISATSCTVDAGGTSVTATLSGTPTASGTFASMITLTDSDVLQSGAIVVPKKTVSFGFNFSIRQEFSITEPNLVDAVQGRAYVKAIATNLESAAAASDVDQVGEFGNGPIAAAGCVETTGNLAAIGLSIGIDPGDPAECLISGTPTSGAGTTINITIAVTDNPIFQAPQAGAVVSAKTIMKNFALSIRQEFSITPFTVVDGVAGRTYNKTFTVSTDLSNVANDVGQATEKGNGPITACALNGLPAGINSTCTLDASGTTVTVTLSGTPTTPGQLTSGIDVTDSDILQNAGIVGNRNTISFSFNFTVRQEFSILEPSLVDGIQGRAYNKTIVTDLVAANPGTDVGQTAELGNGPAATCGQTGLPAGTGLSIAASGGDCVLSGTPNANDRAASPISVTVSVTDNGIFQPPQVAAVVPAKTITKVFTLTIRQEFSIVEPSLVDAVAGRLYTKTIVTNLLAADPGTDIGQGSEFGNGPVATSGCAVNGLPLVGTGLAIAVSGGDCVLSGTPSAADLAASPLTLTISVTDNPIAQLNTRTSVTATVVTANTIANKFNLVVRPDSTFKTTIVVDGITDRAYDKTLATDKNNPNPTGAGNVTSCTFTGTPPAGLNVAVAPNNLDCVLSGPITDAPMLYNFTVVATDADITQVNSRTGLPAVVVAGGTFSQVYALSVRNEFSFLTTSVVDGVAGQPYSKLVETNLEDVAVANDLNTAELGNGPAASCGISTNSGGPFTGAIMVAVTGGTITLGVAPDGALPAPSSCRLTATIPAGVAVGQSASFFVQATDNPITQATDRPPAANPTVVPANSVISGMLTLTVRAAIKIELANSNCNFDAAGNAGAGTFCPVAVVSRTYTDTLVQQASTGGDPPVSWSSQNGTAASLNTGNAACAGLTLNSSTGAITSTPTPTTSGTCTFTVTLADSGIKQATQATHGATPAGTMLTVVPVGSDVRALSIGVRAPMSISAPTPVVANRLPDGLENSPYTVTLVAQNGLAAAGPVGLPATLTWSEPTGLLGSGACTGLSLNTSTGVISGTPTTTGTCGPFTIQVDDDGNAPNVGQFVPATPPGQGTRILTIIVSDTLGFISNFNGNSVRVIDTNNNTATPNLIPLAGASPVGITVNPIDTLFAYVANGAIVHVFCTRLELPLCPAAFANVAGAPTIIPGFGFARDVAVANTGKIGVGSDISGQVVIFNTDRNSPSFNTVVTTVSTPGLFVDGVAVRPQADFAFVATGNADIFAINLSTFVRTNISIGMGASTSHIAISPDGKFAYVSDRNNLRVHVIDISNPPSFAVVASTPPAGTPGGLQATGGFAYAIAFAPDGRFVYVTDYPTGIVAAIDPATLNVGAGTVLVTNNAIAVGSGAGLLALTDDSLKAFVPGEFVPNVSVIDTDATPSATFQTVIATIANVPPGTFVSPSAAGVMRDAHLHLLNPLPDGLESRAYSFSVVATGGMRPFTFSITNGALPSGLTMDANGLITGSPSPGSGSAAGTAYNFDVTVVDGSIPQQRDTRTYTIRIFTLAAVTVAAPPDAIKARTYAFGLAPTGSRLAIFWTDNGTLAADPDCNGISLSSTGRLSGTASLAAASGVCSFTVAAQDASGTLPGFPLPTTLTIRGEYSITPFTLVDAIVGRAYSNTFVINTNLSNSATEVGQAGEFGNGPITTPCTVTSNSLEVVVTGFTCNPTSISVTVAGRPTVTTGILITATVTDSDLVVSSNTVVPKRTTIASFTITVRNEFVVQAITNPVDAVEGRIYTNSVTIPTTLANNPVPGEVGSVEAGNGPVTGCVVLDGATALTNFNGTSTGSLLRGLTVTCNTFGSGLTSALVNFSGTATAGTQETKTLTVRIFDTAIGTVVDIPGNAGNALISNTFMLTFRDEFVITSAVPTLTDAVEGTAYSQTFSVTTDLSVSGTDSGQVAENGNGPIPSPPGPPIGCEITFPPSSGLTASYVLTGGGTGCDVTISSAGVLLTPGTYTLTLTVRDSAIGAATPAGSQQQTTLSLVVNSATLTFAVSAVNSGALTACSLGTLTDPGSGGTLPSNADAVRNRTYGPGRCDLLFTVTGGKKPFIWATLEEALGGMTCTTVTPTPGDTDRGRRCQRTTAVPVGHPLGPDTFTVQATDSSSTPIVGSTSRLINVQDQLNTTRNPLNIPDAVIGRPFGSIGALTTVDLIYTVPANAGLIAAPITLAGTFTGTGIICRQVGTELQCDTDTNGDNTLQAGEVIIGGTTSGSVTATDTANLTTPAGTNTTDPGRQLTTETIIANAELALTNTVLVNGLLNRTYSQELTATGGLDSAAFPRTFEQPTGSFPTATGAGITIVNDADSSAAVPPTLTGRITSGAETLSTVSAAASDFTFSLRARDQRNSTTLSCVEMGTTVIGETCADRTFIVNVLGENGYIANSDDAANNVVRFDAATTPATTTAISMDTDATRSENPNIVGVTPNGRFAWVTKPGDTHDLSAIDTITNTLARSSLPVGPACTPPACDPDNFPTSLAGTPQAFDPATPTTLLFDVWFTNMDSGALQRIAGAQDPATATLGATRTGTSTTANCSTVPASTRFAGVAITPDGMFAFFSNPCDGDVTKADLVGATTSDIAFGTPPGNVAADPRGKFVYVNNVNDANADGVADGEGSIGVINVATGAVVNTIMLTGAGKSCTRPAGLAASPDGNRLFVTCPADGTTSTLVMLDVSDPLLGASFGAALTGSPFNLNATAGDCVFPLGIRFNPEGTRAFIACRVSDTILVLNTSAQPPTIVDANGATAGNAIANSSPSGAVGLDITPNPALHITTAAALPNASVAAAYSRFIVARGGVRVNGGNRNYTFTSADLPVGFALDPSSGELTRAAGGVAGGPFSFTVEVKDNAAPQQKVTKTFMITVVP